MRVWAETQLSALACRPEDKAEEEGRPSPIRVLDHETRNGRRENLTQNEGEEQSRGRDRIILKDVLKVQRGEVDCVGSQFCSRTGESNSLPP